MSKKRYYYFKLSSDFFKRLVIKKMKMMPGGGDLLATYIALIAYSTEEEGVLIYQGIESSLAKELSMVLDCEERITQSLLIFLEGHKLLEPLDNTRFLLVDSVKMIGSETDAAERMRRLREDRKSDPSHQLEQEQKEKKIPMSNAERVRKYRENKSKKNMNSSVADTDGVTDVTLPCNGCNEDGVTCNENVTLQCNEDVTAETLHNINQTPLNRDNVTDVTMFAQSSVTFEHSAIDIDTERDIRVLGGIRARGCNVTPDSNTEEKIQHLSSVYSVTELMIEMYFEFRKRTGGIENWIALEKTIWRNLFDQNSDESHKLEQWLNTMQNEHRVIEHLSTEFLSIPSHIFSRKECLERAKDDFTLKLSNIKPSDMLIEIAYQNAETKRQFTIGGAA